MKRTRSCFDDGQWRRTKCMPVTRETGLGLEIPRSAGDSLDGEESAEQRVDEARSKRPTDCSSLRDNPRADGGCVMVDARTKRVNKRRRRRKERSRGRIAMARREPKVGKVR